jgi:uncharacterized protein (TIGR02118 family)
MIKLVFCLRRRPELSREEFDRYWREQHAPLVRSFADALGARRYVQVRTLDTPANEALRRPRGAPEPFDGVAELWWDDEEALVRATGEQEGRRAARELIEDERRFIDLENSPIWLATEDEIIGR